MAEPLTVLLVDDDPTAQLIALSMLRHLGIEAEVASDGAEGVRKAASHAFDVILMDVQLPVLDGAEAVRAIRAAPGGDRPRIVAVTDYAMSGAEARMESIGFDGVVAKPFSIAVLQNALRPVQAPASAAAEDAGELLLEDIRAHVRTLLGEDDEAFVTDLVESFSDSSRAALGTLGSIRTSRSLEALVRVAHSLKGSSSNVGLASLAETWGAIEARAHHGDASVFDAALAEAVAQTEEAVGHMQSPVESG